MEMNCRTETTEEYIARLEHDLEVARLRLEIAKAEQRQAVAIARGLQLLVINKDAMTLAERTWYNTQAVPFFARLDEGQPRIIPIMAREDP